MQLSIAAWASDYFCALSSHCPMGPVFAPEYECAVVLIPKLVSFPSSRPIRSPHDAFATTKSMRRRSARAHAQRCEGGDRTAGGFRRAASWRSHAGRRLDRLPGGPRAPTVQAAATRLEGARDLTPPFSQLTARPPLALAAGRASRALLYSRVAPPFSSCSLNPPPVQSVTQSAQPGRTNLKTKRNRAQRQGTQFVPAA
jgi:hypothetical protein